MTIEELRYIKLICLDENLSDGETIDSIAQITSNLKDEDSININKIINYDIDIYTDNDCIEEILEYILSKGDK